MSAVADRGIAVAKFSELTEILGPLFAPSFEALFLT